MRLEWDEAKAQANLRKHGVSFSEAAVLLEPGADVVVLYDEEHSTFEDRFITIGPIGRGIALVVSMEPGESSIRLISARWATRRERALYAAHRKGRR